MGRGSCGHRAGHRLRTIAIPRSQCDPRSAIPKRPRSETPAIPVIILPLVSRDPSLRFACNPGVPKVIDEACELGKIDIVCGDINQARWQSADHKWHEGTLDALESRQYMPIADYGGDSCFIALHRSMVEARPRFAAQFLWNRPFLPVSCLCPETVLEPRLTSGSNTIRPWESAAPSTSSVMSVSGDGLGAEIVICVKSTIRPPGIGRSINIQCHVSIPPPPRQACKVSGSSWGERAEKAEEGARREFELNFCQRCGARRQDIHWPLTLSIRVPVVAADGRQLRASGLRQRSAKAKARRAEMKRKRIEDRFGSNSGMDWRDPRAWDQSKKSSEAPQRLLLRPFQRLRFCFGLSCDCPFGRSSGCFFGHSSEPAPEAALRPLQRLLLLRPRRELTRRPARRMGFCLQRVCEKQIKEHKRKEAKGH